MAHYSSKDRPKLPTEKERPQVPVFQWKQGYWEIMPDGAIGTTTMGTGTFVVVLALLRPVAKP